MFVAGDQLLKGAALNAVQIAELLYEEAPVIASLPASTATARTSGSPRP